MAFTDQKPRIATEEECNFSWRGNSNSFRCYLCGYKFTPGDYWRFVFAGNEGYINFLTCESCDGSDVLIRWIAHFENGRKRFWWMND